MLQEPRWRRGWRDECNETCARTAGLPEERRFQPVWTPNMRHALQYNLDPSRCGTLCLTADEVRASFMPARTRANASSGDGRKRRYVAAIGDGWSLAVQENTSAKAAMILPPMLLGKAGDAWHSWCSNGWSAIAAQTHEGMLKAAPAPAGPSAAGSWRRPSGLEPCAPTANA